MNDQTQEWILEIENNDFETQRWPWLVGIAIAVPLFVLVLILAPGLISISPPTPISRESSPNLELMRMDFFFADDGRTVGILNKGSGPITISKVTINDRQDCTVAFFQSAFRPTELKVGDKINLISSCRIVRVGMETSEGSAVYSF